MPIGQTSLEYGTANQTSLFGQPISGGIYDFAPAIDQFLKAHLFGDIFQRDVLDWKHRQLVTVSVLSGIGGVNPQLRGHLGTSLRQGWTEAQLRDAAAIVGKNLGPGFGDNMNSVLNEAIKQ